MASLLRLVPTRFSTLRRLASCPLSYAATHLLPSNTVVRHVPPPRLKHSASKVKTASRSEAKPEPQVEKKYQEPDPSETEPTAADATFREIIQHYVRYQTQREYLVGLGHSFRAKEKRLADEIDKHIHRKEWVEARITLNTKLMNTLWGTGGTYMRMREQASECISCCDRFLRVHKDGGDTGHSKDGGAYAVRQVRNIREEVCRSRALWRVFKFDPLILAVNVSFTVGLVWVAYLLYRRIFS